MRLGEALAGTARDLAAAGVESPRAEAELLVASVLDLLDAPRVALFERLGQGERELSDAQARALASLVRRRLTGEPVQYVVGRAWFRGLCLEVGRGVLIPRPETEGLAGEVIAWLERRSAAAARAAAGPAGGAGDGASGGAGDSPLVLDLGTGTGCIALAVATESPSARVVGSDLSRDALAYAERNGRRADARSPGTAARVSWLAAEGFTAFRRAPSFDAVVSNPPYVSEAGLPGLQREVREHEPAAALLGGRDGTRVLAAIVEEACGFLRPGGLLALEVGDGQADNVAARIAARSAYGPARVVEDLARRPRVVLAERRR